LDHHAVRLLQAIDEVRLERAAPGADLVVEEAGDRDRGVEAEVPAERGMTYAAPAEDSRRVDRARGDDDHGRADREPSLHGVRVGREQHGLDAGRATPLDRDALRPAAGVEPRAGRLRGGEVGEMHRLLGVAGTAEGALAAPPAADD